MRIGFKTAQIRVDWQLLDEIWDCAGSLPVFRSAWLLDHLSPPSGDGPCLEGWTTLALLAHRVPDKQIGHLVIANPLHHPALLAKMATAMDIGTGGRFVLGIGAGDYAWEGSAYGLPYPALTERLRDLESSLQVIRALFGPDAATWPDSSDGSSVDVGGVSLEAPPYRLSHARNDPAPLTTGGPPIWVGALGERVGLRLAAQYGDGWNFSGPDPADFAAKREVLYRHCERIGRDPATITLAAQVWVGEGAADRQAARLTGQAFAAAGCHELILRMAPGLGPDGLRRLAEEVAEALS